MKIAVACNELVLAGGLLRFERIGESISRNDHELVFVTFAVNPKYMFPSRHRNVAIEDACREQWDATIIPGAGFPTEIIDRLHVFLSLNFGVRIQMILSDQRKRSGFLRVNASMDPDLVIFNNLHWPIGSFREFRGRQFHYLIGAVDTVMFQRGRKAPEKGFIIGAQIRKNPAPLIEAIRLLPDHFKLRFFGPVDQRVLVDSEDLLMAGRITLAGPLFGNELAEYYRGLSAMVSTETYAGWANVVAEAMASNVPVVTTPAGTLSLAFHEDTALVMASPAPTSIAAHLKQLHDQPDLASAMASRARQHIESFTWHAYSGKLLDLIRDFDGQTH